MFDFIGDIIGELLFGAITAFFRTTRWLSIIYLAIAISVGVLVGNQIGYFLSEGIGILTCGSIVLVLLVLLTFVHVRLFRRV